MKIKLSCSKCVVERKYRQEDDKAIEINDQDFYQLTCKYGHETTIFLSQHRYEILFDMGVYALVDGYVREAVSSLAASIERLYEFCIDVLLTSENIDYRDFQSTWKYLKNSSERQYGAFLMLHLEQFHNKPIILKDNDVKFRNDVIHKGKIPSTDDVIEYADRVFNYIKTILINYKAKLPSAITKVQERDIIYYIEETSSKDVLDPDSVVLWSIDTIFKSERPIEEIKSIDFIKEYNRRKTYKIFC